MVSKNDELKVYHYHNDHLGTPNELTDEDGEVIWLADYNAWGTVSDICKDFSYVPQTVGNVEISADELQPIRFQGQFYDTETGLHYNRFRYYDCDLGMFISRDPIGLLGGNNVFQYAPNPVMWVDPFGLAKQSRLLGKNVTGSCSWSGKEAHHIIPESLEEHDVLRNINFKMNNAPNGIMLPRTTNSYMSEHRGGHKIYTDAVRNELDHIGKKYANNIPQQKRAVQELQRNLERALRFKKLPLYLTKCGKKTGLKREDWTRYIKSSRRY